MSSDISKSRSSQKCIHDRMDNHIRIRMSQEVPSPTVSSTPPRISSRPSVSLCTSYPIPTLIKPFITAFPKIYVKSKEPFMSCSCSVCEHLPKSQKAQPSSCIRCKSDSPRSLFPAVRYPGLCSRSRRYSSSPAYL